MKKLIIAPFAAILALMAPPSEAAHGTIHAFQGSLCQPLAAGTGAVSYGNGIAPSSKVEGATVICPISRTLSLSEEGKAIMQVDVVVNEFFLSSEHVSCTLYLTNSEGVTEYTAVATSTPSYPNLLFSILGTVYSRYGRLQCTLPPFTSIRSYDLVDWPF